MRPIAALLVALALAACSPYQSESSIGDGIGSSTPTPKNDSRVQGCDGICGELIRLNDAEACYSTAGGAVADESSTVCYPRASNFTMQSGVRVGLNVEFILDSTGTKVVRLELATG